MVLKCPRRIVNREHAEITCVDLYAEYRNKERAQAQASDFLSPLVLSLSHSLKLLALRVVLF